MQRENELTIWIVLATLCRAGETMKAEWKDVGLQKAEWFLPAANTNTKAPMFVFLSPFALRQFEELHLLTGHTHCVVERGRPERSVARRSHDGGHRASACGRGVTPSHFAGAPRPPVMFMPDRTPITRAVSAAVRRGPYAAAARFTPWFTPQAATKQNGLATLMLTR